ncbi:MAG: helix-turn-helix transcriptional regulator [Clostridia bacterium]|nr:helix-turn-helix transcriptional regulator [Clostridia bacterium]
MILNIADRIKYLRDKADLTQTDLARALGISRSAVNSWEMSLSTPSLSNIVEMTKIFHINADYLLGANDKIFADITELSNEEREIVLRLIECLKKK